MLDARDELFLSPTRPLVRLLAVVVLLVVLQLVIVVDSTPLGSLARAEAEAEATPVAEVEATPVVQPVAPPPAGRVSLQEDVRIDRIDIEVRGDAVRFGTPERIGDIDGDGITDLAVGAYSDDAVGTDAGALHIVFMNADGSVRDRQRITAGVGGFTGELLADGGFGFRIAGLGDLDGDGIPDVAVSAYRSDRAGEEAGEVWILFLARDGSVRSSQVITSGSGGLDVALAPGDQFGVDVALVGDLDADGVGDLAVGAWHRDGATTDDGSVFLLRLNTDGTVKRSTEISASSGWPGVLADGAGFGVSVDRIGDLDGNGADDLAIGAIDGAAARGEVHIARMGDDGSILGVSALTPGVGLTPERAAGDRFGASVAGIGDVDDDGVREIAVGAIGINDFSGGAWIFSIDSEGVAASVVRMRVRDLDPGDLFGHTIDSLGDLNGDGSTDLAVGAPGEDTVSEDHGSVFFVQFAEAPDTGPRGDLDGDGVSNGLEGDDDVDGDGEANNVDLDSDGDRVPDEVEARRDTDDDGFPDRVDADDDGDGIPSRAEGPEDDDVDGLANSRDTDSDDDGIDDTEEGRRDTDDDGTPDRVDTDSDGDGIDDDVEGAEDTDDDGVPNFVDRDADGDGVADRNERDGDADGDGVADALDSDSDDDGLPDADEGRGDADDDGTPDRVDSDADDDGLADRVEGNEDSDGDGVADNQDLDSDDDGVTDADEGRGDVDDDGTPDRVDNDADGDGVADRFEGDEDSDDDGIADRIETDSDDDGVADADEGRADTDRDGTPDRADADSDGDGIGDSLEGAGDVDDDGTPNRTDLDSDGDGLLDADEGQADADDDGVVDFLDERTMRAAVGIRVFTPEDLVAGEVNDFVLVVENAGPDRASLAEASVLIPEGLAIDAATLPEGCELDGRRLTCRFGALEANESATRTISAMVAPGVEEVEFEARVAAPEGTPVLGSSGPLDVIDRGLERAADGLGSPRGALTAVLVVMMICGGAILALTRDRSVPT